MESTRRRFCRGKNTVLFRRVVADLATIYNIHIHALIGEIREYGNSALYITVHTVIAIKKKTRTPTYLNPFLWAILREFTLVFI